MQFIFSALKRQNNEEQSQFDNRIQRMLPFLSGFVYFDLRNYNPESGEFNVYIEWNEELMDMLHYRLPSGGYYVKATIKQAYEFHNLKTGLPVYMKLVSRDGRIYPYRTYTMAFGRPYSVEFGGEMLIPFEDRYEELGCVAAKKENKSFAGSSHRIYLNGSQKVRINSSQKLGINGSQGFRLNSSQRFEVFGSQRFRLTGSQRGYLFGSRRDFLFGSQRSFLFGSQRGFLSGSQAYAMITGSQRETNDRFQYNGLPPVWTAAEYWSLIPPEWQIINHSRRPVEKKGGNARLGYGLDLI